MKGRHAIEFNKKRLFAIFQHRGFRTHRAKILFTAFGIALFAISTILATSSSTDQTSTAEYHSADRKVGVQVVETWVEEWDPDKRCWIRIDRPSAGCSSEVVRLVEDEILSPGVAFGPFVVLSERVAGLVGTTDSQSLKYFERMIAAYPDIDQLNFIDAPGTIHDVSNLMLGRLIRASGLSTHVPSNGSARSGAVDLFIAGVRRTMDNGARFAVHCWSDVYGRSPHDFDEHDPVNELYLNYYMDMGMSHDKAHEFYAMTNSVPHTSALWFGPEEMQKWIDTPSEFDPAEDNRRRRLLDNERREPVQPSTRCPASANDILNGNSGSGMSAE